MRTILDAPTILTEVTVCHFLASQTGSAMNGPDLATLSICRIAQCDSAFI